MSQSTASGSGPKAEAIEVECFCHSQNFVELPRDNLGAPCGPERSSQGHPKLPSVACPVGVTGLARGVLCSVRMCHLELGGFVNSLV